MLVIFSHFFCHKIIIKQKHKNNKHLNKKFKNRKRKKNQILDINLHLIFFSVKEHIWTLFEVVAAVGSCIIFSIITVFCWFFKTVNNSIWLFIKHNVMKNH